VAKLESVLVLEDLLLVAVAWTISSVGIT